MLLSSELVRSKHRPSRSLISRTHNHTLEIPSFSWFHMVGPHSSGQHSPLSCCLSSLFRSSPINWPRESATSGSTLRRKTGTGDKWRHRACSILTSTQILGPWLLAFPLPPPPSSFVCQNKIFWVRLFLIQMRDAKPINLRTIVLCGNAASTSPYHPNPPKGLN